MARCSLPLPTPEAFSKAPDCGKTPSDASSLTVVSCILSLPSLSFSRSTKLQIPSAPSCSPCLSFAPQSPSSETSSGYSWKVFHLLLHQIVMRKRTEGIKIPKRRDFPLKCLEIQFPKDAAGCCVMAALKNKKTKKTHLSLNPTMH